MLKLCYFLLSTTTILCTISLAPPSVINHKNDEVSLHILEICILATEICNMLIASRFVLRVMLDYSERGRSVKITLLMPILVIFLSNDVFHITIPN